MKSEALEKARAAQDIIEGNLLVSVKEYNRLRNSIYYHLCIWFDSLDILVYIANNEQTPWRSEDIGHQTARMPLKSETGFNQVGDYQFTIDGTYWGGLLAERKSIGDLYGTLFKERDRFYRELERYKKNPLFDTFVILVEGNFIDFLNYTANSNSYMINEKTGAIASLTIRGASVLFCSNPKLAANEYNKLIKQWCFKNCWRYLNGT